MASHFIAFTQMRRRSSLAMSVSRKLILILGLSLPLVGLPIGSVQAGEGNAHRGHSLILRPHSAGSPPDAFTGKETVARTDQAHRLMKPVPPTTTGGQIADLPTSNQHRRLTKRPATLPPTPTATTPLTPQVTQHHPVSSAPPVANAGMVPDSSAPVKPKSGTANGTQAKAGSSNGITMAFAAPLVPVGSAGAVPSTPIAFTAAAGSGAIPSQSSGSRAPQALFQRPEFVALLQPPTPTVTTPPSDPPPSSPPPSPPSSSPPSSPPSPPPSTVGSAILSWNASPDTDLAGYKVYVGTQSGGYTFTGSPFTVGNVTGYTLNNLPKGQTYYFALSAYDTAGNESILSAEASKSIF